MSKRLRLLILGIFAVLGALSLYPTIKWYFFTSDELKALAVSNRTLIRNQAIDLAEKDTEEILEILQGNSDDVFKEGTVTSEGHAALLKIARARSKENKKALADNAPASEVFTVFADRNEIHQLLLDYYREKYLTHKNTKDKIIKLGLDLSGGVSASLKIDRDDLEERLGHSPGNIEIEQAIDRAMLVLQNRIDKFGVSEPSLRKLNNDSILVEIPGEDDREQINSFLQGKGAISFMLVDDEATEELIELQRDDPTWTYTGKNNPDFIQAGTEIMEYVVRDSFGLDRHQRWIVVYQDIDSYGIDGEHLKQAQVSTDPFTNRPLVNFQLDEDGAQKFAKLTSDHLNESMAILMESKVRAYATLSTVISSGNAVIQGFSRDLANDIAIVLQTAALPVNLLIVDQEVVGPTLGKRVIEQGLNAITIGFLLVIIFMLVYYIGSGITAVITLLCNLFFLMAILAAFNFTLTLTGIAAVILTVGMAVDANVLIYERIKEELQQKKTRATAIENGFRKAFWTILDANITTLVASIFIAQLASGRIQGFAVTLSTGIITTLFTVLFISRLLFDIGTETIKLKKINISWRKIKS